MDKCTLCAVYLEREMFLAGELLKLKTQHDIAYYAGVLEGVQWMREPHQGSYECDTPVLPPRRATE